MTNVFLRWPLNKGKYTYKKAVSDPSGIPGAYAGGGVHWVHVHPPPTWEKSSPQKCPKEEIAFRPDISAKKECARSAQMPQN